MHSTRDQVVSRTSFDRFSLDEARQQNKGIWSRCTDRTTGPPQCCTQHQNARAYKTKSSRVVAEFQPRRHREQLGRRLQDCFFRGRKSLCRTHRHAVRISDRCLETVAFGRRNQPSFHSRPSKPASVPRRVANPASDAHIPCMASTAPSPAGKSSAVMPKRVGRSAVTGQYVLAPASKGSKITIAKARSAANTVHSSKK